MLTSPPQKRSRYRVCGRVLPAWLPVAQRPDGAMQSITNAGACWPPAWGT
jgi:hypothetical protein